MADFKFYLSRQGPKGEPGAKGDKGDNGNTPTFSDGINTPTVYTMQIDMGDGNVFETQNLKYPMRDDGGNYLRYDRTNSTVTLSAPNIADLQRTSGEVTLASVSDVENEDAQDADAVSIELRNADQLALSNEINRIDRDIDTVDTKVDGEIQNRQNADTALGGRIDGLDSSKADKTDVYTKAQTDALLSGKANTVHTHNLSQITDAGSLAGKNTVDYNSEVTNKPTIGNGTITITQGGVTKGTFTTNQSGNSTIELDAGGGGGTTYTAGPGITINQNDEISANVDNNTIVIDGNSLKANIPDVSNFVTNTQLANTLESYPTNNALSNAIAYQTVSVPTPPTYTPNGTINLISWEYSLNRNVETNGVWTKVGTSTYTRDRQLVIPSDSSYDTGLWVTFLNLQDTECVKCNSGYTFSFECNPQITISYYSPEDSDTLITQRITIDTPNNEVFNISSSSYGYISLNIGVLKNVYIKSLMVQYNYDGNGHTPSVFLAPIYNSNGEVEVYTRSEGIPVTTTKAVVADTAVDGSTISVDSNGQLTYIGPTGDVLPSQSGNSGKFLTTDGSTTSWATVSQPDMTQYYTKSQTDSLLDEKIDNDVVQYPLQYLPDTTDSLTYQNINTSTMTGSGMGVGVSGQNQSYPDYKVYDNTNNTNYDLRSYPEAINLENLCWFETRLTNGLNIGFKGSNYSTNSYVYALGHYDNNNIFILDALIQAGYVGCHITVIDGNNPSQTYLFSGGYGMDTNYEVGGCSLDNTTLRIRTNYYSSNTTISSSAKEILDQVTHIRVFKGRSGDSPVTLSLSSIKVINPTLSQNDCGNIMDSTVLSNYDNIFDAHPASLSLKYDSNTLGVNANNELYALSSTPSNMVTTNTSQTITGQKTFDSNYTFVNTDKVLRIGSDGASQHIDLTANTYNSVPRLSIYNSRDGHNYGLEFGNHMYDSKYRFWLRQPNGSTSYYDSKIYKSNSSKASFTSSDLNNFLLEKDMIDGTTITYDSSTGKISATGGGGSVPTNMVTTDTDQDITGTKQFINKGIRFFDASGSYSSHVVTIGWGEIKVGWNSHNMIWNTNSSSHQFSNGVQNVLYSYGTSTSVAGVVFGGGWRLYRCNSAQNAYYGPDQTTYPYIPYLDSEMLDGTYLKWDSSTKKITVDIQAIKDAIDALSSSAGEGSFNGGTEFGG